MRITYSIVHLYLLLVVKPISVNFIQRLDVVVWGVTKLRNEIHVLCRSTLYSTRLAIDSPVSDPTVIRVFEDQSPFDKQRDIEIKEMASASDIASSEKDNCLYVADSKGKCVWKVTRETDNKYKILKWLTLDEQPRTLSVSSDGQLLVVGRSSSILRIYGSNGKLLRSIQLPEDIQLPLHAVKTSTGNIVILHKWMVEGGEKERVSSWSGSRERIISKLTRDGKRVIHRYIPANEEQALNSPSYLSLDSNDRVIVADWGENRVILFNHNLSWIRILCPTGEERVGEGLSGPQTLYYDKEKKQLIVGGSGIYIYNLN